MLTVGAVLNWVPVREPLRTSIMGALHVYDDDPVRILAALPGEVIQEALRQLDATPTDAARMEVAWDVALKIVGTRPTKQQREAADKETEDKAGAERDRQYTLELERVKAEAAASAAAAAAAAATTASQGEATQTGTARQKTSSGGKIRLDHTVYQLSDELIDYMSKDEVNKYYANYFARFGGDPPKEETPSLEQLSALRYLLKEKANIYVDFAIWGPYDLRKQRELHFMGMIVGPGNVLQQVEIRGPPTFEAWLACFAVLRTALIMLGEVEPNTLDLYVRRIRKLNARYGERAWALLYQTEARMRHEEFPVIFRWGPTRSGKSDHPAATLLPRPLTGTVLGSGYGTRLRRIPVSIGTMSL